MILTNHSEIYELHSFLYQNEMKIATAESCTSGAIGDLLTSISGSSEYYYGGVIVYSEHMKTKLLNISREFLENNGVVSPEVAVAMAESVYKNLKTHFSISSTGLADVSNYPKYEKPFCYIGLHSNSFSKSYRVEAEGNRNEVKKKFALRSVELILDEIDKHWGLDK